MKKNLVFLPYRTENWLLIAKKLSSQLEKTSPANQSLLVDYSDYQYPVIQEFNAGHAKFMASPFLYVRLGSREFEKQGDSTIAAVTSQAISIRGDWRGRVVNGLSKRERKYSEEGIRRISMSKANFDRIHFFVIPNGRFDLQVELAKLAADLESEPLIRYYETNVPGFAHNPLGPRFFFADFPVHSRERLQNALGQVDLSNINPEQVFQSWLEPRRKPLSSANYFASRWSDENSVSKNSNSQGRRLNLFLTSSTDEFVALGGEWDKDSWEDQYEAFEKIISKLKNQGEDNFAIRIHPNLANKSIRFVREEIKRINWIRTLHPDLRVYGPLSNQNTYALIENSQRIFVSLSMAGLEASGLGVPVWHTMANNYDMSADVKPLLSERQLEIDTLEPWNVDQSKAHRYVASALLFGVPYENSSPPSTHVTVFQKFKASGYRDADFRFVFLMERLRSRLLAQRLLRRGT